MPDQRISLPEEAGRTTTCWRTNSEYQGDHLVPAQRERCQRARDLGLLPRRRRPPFRPQGLARSPRPGQDSPPEQGPPRVLLRRFMEDRASRVHAASMLCGVDPPNFQVDTHWLTIGRAVLRRHRVPLPRDRRGRGRQADLARRGPGAQAELLGQPRPVQHPGPASQATDRGFRREDGVQEGRTERQPGDRIRVLTRGVQPCRRRRFTSSSPG